MAWEKGGESKSAARGGRAGGNRLRIIWQSCIFEGFSPTRMCCNVGLQLSSQRLCGGGLKRAPVECGGRAASGINHSSVNEGSMPLGPRLWPPFGCRWSDAAVAAAAALHGPRLASPRLVPVALPYARMHLWCVEHEEEGSKGGPRGHDPIVSAPISPQASNSCLQRDRPWPAI
jgi:hypothetical protein